MRRGSIETLAVGAFAVAMAVLPLAACSSIGSSSFGNNQLKVAEISNISSYTADGALTEARSHFRNNDFGYSAALYKRVVELSPKDAEGYIGLSASYDRLHRFDLADRVYASLYTISGGTAQYYNNVGYSYMLRGNLAAALTNFRKAQKLDPNNAVISNNLQIMASAIRA
ncbi:MAG: tetratricopeptide repeat protein [Devosia sp.]